MAEPFWDQVDPTAGPTACWPWTGTLNPRSGYGQWHPRRGATEHAHRQAYRLYYGRIPEGAVIDHVRALGCTRKDCCNPAHLEAVSQGENVRRGDATWQGGRCRSGLHDITDPANVEIRPNGKRRCVQCRRASARARWAKKGA